jgi:hypothetical protein
MKTLDRFLIGLWLLFFTLFAIGTAKAAIFCVSDASELQDALTTAASNGEDDTVQIVQGTYVGSFDYDSTEAHSLAIEGGYTPGCGTRDVDPANTVLAAGSGIVLWLETSGPLEVDGLTVRNDGDSLGPDYGIYAQSSSGTLTFTNNMISEGINGVHWGSIIYARTDSGSITFTDNTIRGHYSSRIGAAVDVGSNSGTITFTGNTISDNSSRWSTGGVEARTDSGPITFTSNTITGNSAWEGAAGGGVHATSNSGTITFTNNIVTKNKVWEPYEGEHGGGIYARSTSGTIAFINNIVAENFQDGWGSGIYAESDSGTITLINNTITKNVTYYRHGGLVLKLYSNDAVADIINNIVWDNTCYPICYGGDDLHDDLYIDNDGDGDLIPSTVNIYNNDFDQSPLGTYIQIPFPIDPSNLDDEDPLFMDAASGDYHLTGTSPCIDAGTDDGAPSEDIDGEPRPLGPACDVGADEFRPEFGPNCGDRTVQWHLGEECEIGVGNECGPTAQCIDCICIPLVAHCGDGIVQWKLGEQCELGVGNECGPYGDCIDCVCVNPPAFCGDGKIQWKAGETCDPPGSICGSRGNPNWVCSDTCQCEFVGGN